MLPRVSWNKYKSNPNKAHDALGDELIVDHYHKYEFEIKRVDLGAKRCTRCNRVWKLKYIINKELGAGYYCYPCRNKLGLKDIRDDQN